MPSAQKVIKVTGQKEYEDARKSARTWLLDHLAEAPQFEMAVNEAMNNAVVHGMGHGADIVMIELTALQSEVKVTVSDNGIGFEPPASLFEEGHDQAGDMLQCAANEMWERGRGLWMMKAMSDHLHIHGRGNKVTLIKYKNSSFTNDS
ncbi:anti-sigma regulatory factor (Ser/Thr protein kinase) [Salsuginibacillus halophilus]|uniref:Anti-sigma regulatory factor (Ser/Thr protein kinase) n=1 Tax=Salsuginibacillus halophilus TaxID=517424 RepID=A0A2P8HLC1_9BACI|nr:ATP-binding protein [Salsuginibacillus halophilus]PSL47022.1 anti-sigma regulatory factor (Ser/Thr protein kinase) [Salsuginibacillus halophilus]